MEKKRLTRNKNITNGKVHRYRNTCGKGRKSSTHKYATKIRNHEKRRVSMQDTGDALIIKRPTN